MLQDLAEKVGGRGRVAHDASAFLSLCDRQISLEHHADT
jgi:hypothetical protein